MTHDPLAEALLRGVDAKQHLVEEAGGLLSLGEAAELLQISSQAVTKLRMRGMILAVPGSHREWLYPACQFDGPELIRGVGKVLGAFRDDEHPWVRLSVLLAASDRFGGRSALDLLREGRVADAESIAGTYGVQG